MILALTGTNGAGKGTVVEYLIREMGFKHYSARDFIVTEIEKQKLPIDRNSMRIVGNELRSKYGEEYVISELCKEAQKNGGNAVIESVRTIGEVNFLERNNIPLWAVDADPHLRYERVKIRGGSTDVVSFEDFIDQEEKESNSLDPKEQNIRACVLRAKTLLTNNGTLADFFSQIRRALGQV